MKHPGYIIVIFDLDNQLFNSLHSTFRNFQRSTRHTNVFMKFDKIEGSFTPTEDSKCASSTGGMVSAVFPEAAQAGVEMLRRGGNASGWDIGTPCQPWRKIILHGRYNKENR